MKGILSGFTSFFATAALLAGLIAFAPGLHAQTGNTTVRVRTVPDGIYFWVDGQKYKAPFVGLWPIGSKHTLFIESTVQDGLQFLTRYVFRNWTVPGTNTANPTAIISADPTVPEYIANFDTFHAIRLAFSHCDELNVCAISPGQVCLDPGGCYDHDTDLYYAAGAVVTATGVPNPGFTFSGFQPGPNQTLQGLSDMVTMNGPAVVYPIFLAANTVTLQTVPEGMQVLADGVATRTPASMSWGWGSTHAVAPLSPQLDPSGQWWVFGSWSDGGASVHPYHVVGSAPNTLTLNYAPAAGINLQTTPAGLPLKVDGRTDWPRYDFVWGVGETHKIEAPTPQIDDNSRAWSFASWSNGGSAAQDVSVPDSARVGGIRLMARYDPLAHLIVKSSLAGLVVKVDGADCATPCDLLRPVGTPVRVSAPVSVAVAEDVRWDFNGFPNSAAASGAEWVATLGADPVTLLANYHVVNLLKVSATPPEGAALDFQPPSADGYYDADSTVTVTIKAQPGFKFRYWSGDITGSNPVAVLAMNAPRRILAQLDRVPYIAPAGITNAAGITPQAAVAPGSIVSIAGASLASDTFKGPDSPLAQTLGGLVVSVGSRVLPLFSVSPTQINFQVPVDLPEGAQTLTVSPNGQPAVQADFVVARNAPGLFQQDASQLALATHADGSLVTADAPAQRGELLTLYGTGFGPTSPDRLDGFAVPKDPPFVTVDPASVMFGDVAIPAETAFAAPGRVGVDAVQFRLTDAVPSGSSASLQVKINGQLSNTVLLPVQ